MYFKDVEENVIHTDSVLTNSVETLSFATVNPRTK